MLSSLFLAGQLTSPVPWFRLPHARHSFTNWPSWKIRHLRPHINTLRVRIGSIMPLAYMYLSPFLNDVSWPFGFLSCANFTSVTRPTFLSFKYCSISCDAIESGMSLIVIFSRFSSGDNCYVMLGFLSNTGTETPLMLICRFTHKFNLAGRSDRYIRHTPRIFWAPSTRDLPTIFDTDIHTSYVVRAVSLRLSQFAS